MTRLAERLSRNSFACEVHGRRCPNLVSESKGMGTNDTVICGKTPHSGNHGEVYVLAAKRCAASKNEEPPG